MMRFDIMTVDEVAEELHCSKGLIYRAIRGRVDGAPALPAIKLGRRRLVRRAVLNQWMEESDGAGRKLLSATEPVTA